MQSINFDGVNRLALIINRCSQLILAESVDLGTSLITDNEMILHW